MNIEKHLDAVYNVSENVNDLEAVTDSLIVADMLGKKVKRIHEVIKVVVEDMGKAGIEINKNGGHKGSQPHGYYLLEEVEYFDAVNHRQRKYLMNKAFFTMLASKFKGVKAIIIQDKLITRFIQLDHANKSRMQARLSGKSSRLDYQIEMDRLKLDPVQMGYYTNCVYNACFSSDYRMTADEVRKIKKLNPEDATRDFFTETELALIKKFESAVAGLIPFMDIEEAIHRVQEKFRDDGLIPITLTEGVARKSQSEKHEDIISKGLDALIEALKGARYETN